MLKTATQLESALQENLTEQACDLLVLDLAGLARDRKEPSLECASWPSPWNGARASAELLGSHRVWWVSNDAPSHDGWPAAFPVWLAHGAGAKAMLVLGRAPAETKGPYHLTDVVNISQHSPLIGLGPSPRGPLFPDRTGVLNQELSQAIGESIGSTPVIVADSHGDEGPGPWEFVIEGISIPLSAAAHVGLPTVALALNDCGDRGQPLAMDAIIQDLLRGVESP